MLKALGFALLAGFGPWGAVDASAGSADRRVRVNGVQFELRSLVLAGDPETLAERLDGRWGARHRLPERSARQVLGRQRGPFHETLTLSAGPRAGFSRVVLAVHDLRQESTPMPSPPLPLPAGARLLNVVQFLDSAEAAAAYTIEMPGAAGAVLERIRIAAAARGWRPLAAPMIPGATGSGFWAQRGGRELTLVVLPSNGRTRLVMLDGRGAAAADASGAGQ